MLSASQPISDQGNQPNKDAPVTRESYESDIRAITDELRAINNDIARNEANRANNDKYWYVFGDNAPVWSNWFIFLTAIAAGGIAVRAFNHERQAVRLTQRAMF